MARRSRLLNKTSLASFLLSFLVLSICVTSPQSARAADDEGCLRQASDIDHLNGPSLMEASEACAKTGNDFDALFLRHIGGIRLATDLAILFPATDADDIQARKLAKVRRGYGTYEDYRDTQQNTELLDKLRAWTPAFDESYHPGWAYHAGVPVSAYQDMVGQYKARRLTFIRNQANLAARDDFLANQEEQRAIFRRNENGVRSGTDDARLYVKLRAVEKEIRKQVEEPRPQVMFPHPREFNAIPSDDFAVLFVSFNGPNFHSVNTYSEPEQFKTSWLRHVLTRSQMAEILSNVSFQEYLIFALPFGPKEDITGPPHIYRYSYNAIENRTHFIIGLEVAEAGCHHAPSQSFPYVIFAVKRPPSGSRYSATYWKFHDGCKPPLSSASAHTLEIEVDPSGIWRLKSFP